jgi:hypothetical protein
MKWSSLVSIRKLSWTQMSGFSMVVRLPFEIGTPLNHSGTGQVRFFDGACIYIFNHFVNKFF